MVGAYFANIILVWKSLDKRNKKMQVIQACFILLVLGLMCLAPYPLPLIIIVAQINYWYNLDTSIQVLTLEDWQLASWWALHYCLRQAILPTPPKSRSSSLYPLQFTLLLDSGTSMTNWSPLSCSTRLLSLLFLLLSSFFCYLFFFSSFAFVWNAWWNVYFKRWCVFNVNTLHRYNFVYSCTICNQMCI